MAGMIEVRPGEQWTAASWLFDWVLSTVAEEVVDVEFAGYLRGVVAENIGFLPIHALSEQQRSQFRNAVTSLSVSAANTWRDFDGHDDALDHLHALQALYE